jgi:hypothetical protein
MIYKNSYDEANPSDKPGVVEAGLSVGAVPNRDGVAAVVVPAVVVADKDEVVVGLDPRFSVGAAGVVLLDAAPNPNPNPGVPPLTLPPDMLGAAGVD